MTEIDVRCERAGAEWRCAVHVVSGPRTATFDVTSRDPAALLPDAGQPTRDDLERLVAETFRFLLEREPVTSILSTFDLTVVARYFPEYPAEIRCRLARLPD
jgi:hypothetical protein